MLLFIIFTLKSSVKHKGANLNGSKIRHKNNKTSHKGADSSRMVVKKENCNSNARKMVMLLSGKYCRNKEFITAIVKQFNMKLSAFNIARQRFRIKLNNDKELQHIKSNIEQKIKMCVNVQV